MTDGARVDLVDFIGQPPWHDRILISLLGYNQTAGSMMGSVHFTSDPFLMGFPVDTNVTGNVRFPMDEWRRVTVTWDGLDGAAVPKAMYYVDNALVASHTGAPGSIMMLPDAPAQFYVGRFLQDASDPRPVTVLDELTIRDHVVRFDSVRPGSWRLKVYDHNLPAYHHLETPEQDLTLEPGQSAEITVRVLPKARQIRFIDEGIIRPNINNQ